MRGRLLFLPLLVLAASLLGGCNLDPAHNREHRARWREGMREFHDQVDHYLIDPLTTE